MLLPSLEKDKGLLAPAERQKPYNANNFRIDTI